MTAPAAVAELIARFESHQETYRSDSYNEAQLRAEFVNPFFEALGWDIYNKKRYADAYKEVIHEAAIKIGGRTKAPDYCFRAGGGKSSFFVEAKKPAIEVGEDATSAYQLRRYGWSAKLPASILTNFAEFAVYDCRIRPVKTDKASTARVKYLGYTEYVDRWDELCGLFSPEAIHQGALDKFLASHKVKKGTAEVDAAFLREIESWRMELARNIALRNGGLPQRDLNFAVQRTIDRMVFLRICEDRGIEPYGNLQKLLNTSNVYRLLAELFQQADDRYNSGLFHFTPEKGRPEPPDELTLGLTIDDRPLQQIIRGLYYPDSPYEFSVIPTEILGQVYEQFLGMVIRLTEGHQAKVEEKLEVRKAGGVYYTPEYIVDYIVRHTVGKLVEKKTPRQVEKLHVLDPACGSGSFLIGAYQFLLDWHRDWYVAHDAEKHARGRQPRLYRGPGGDWRLTSAEKKRILLNSIYGVDIDSQAVEVTKLALLLKVLEGESKETVNNQLRLLHERALPDLGNNIKCGNSLIGPDFYEGRQMNMLDEEEIYRVNAFDWQAEFPEVFKGKGGRFDAVMGNPPYVNAWGLFTSMPDIREYINKSGIFTTAKRHWDLYILFLEKAFQLVRKNGYVSFIIPYSYAIQKYGMASRELLLRKATILRVADFRMIRVFGRVPVITIIPVLQKTLPDPRHRVAVDLPDIDAVMMEEVTVSESHRIRQTAFLEQHEYMLRLDLSDAALALCRKVEEASLTVGDICWVNYGAQMSSKRKGTFGKEFVLRDRKQTRTCCKTVSGRNLYRYRLHWEGKYVEWALADQMYGAREEWFFSTPKLMIRDITGTHRLELTVDRFGMYCDHTILCALRAVDIQDYKALPQDMVALSENYSLELLQGLLASRLVSAYYYLKLTGEGVRTGGGFHTYPKTIRHLRVFRVQDASRRQSTLLRRIADCAAGLLSFQGRLEAAHTPQAKTAIQRQIEATDRQIDQLVYELYGLTDAEITIIEEATGQGA